MLDYWDNENYYYYRKLFENYYRIVMPEFGIQAQQLYTDIGLHLQC